MAKMAEIQNPDKRNIDKNLEKFEPSYIADRIVNSHSDFGKEFGSFSKCLRYNYNMVQQFYYQIYNEEQQKQKSTQNLVHECSQQHHSNSPNWNNPNTHQFMNEQTKCATSIQ
jgi:hypothetical protein